MCGFAGFLSFNPSEKQVLALMGAIKHRGPDDCGVWLDASSGIGVAHQRLSILDLSSSGSQPHSPSGPLYCF